MAKNLLESYSKRIALAESVHKKTHNGAGMSAQKKLMLATLLDNTSKFMNEAFDSSAATQRSALGDYKRFCLNITNVSVPNLILPEIMLTQPMTSIAGYITYLRYTAGTTKGGVNEGDFFNGVYRMGEMTEDRTRYTSDNVNESHTIDANDKLVDIANKKVTLDWAPVLGVKSIAIIAENGDRTPYTPIYEGQPTKATAAKATDGTVLVDKTNGKLSFASDDAVFAENSKVVTMYVYDNVIIPQKETPTSLPTLKAHLDAIDLHAHARRIAIYYSQIAAFQAKNDYGFDMAQQLATQAQGELAYEVDTEGVLMLYNGAEKDTQLTFAKYVDDKAISRSQYYEAFSEIVARAKKIIYTRTQKFAPNYMVCGADVLTVLPYVKGWTPAPASVVNGPYFAGTLDSLKVFVSPSIPENEFFFGVNGSDLQTSAGVYAPYMAVVPTQLLGLPDGTQTQGFSMMYDMRLLSTYNRNTTTGAMEDAVDGHGQYSYLLVGGKLTSTPTYLNVQTTEAKFAPIQG